MVAYPDRCVGNDPKPFGVSLSPPRLNIITLGNMGVMMYLGQGGPHSLRASSLFLKLRDKNVITIKKIFFQFVKIIIIILLC